MLLSILNNYIIVKPIIDEDLLCTICCDLVVGAMQSPCCGSLYCYECISKWVSSSTNDQDHDQTAMYAPDQTEIRIISAACPYCRAVISMNSLQKDLRSDRKSSEHLRACPIKNCKFIGNRKAMIEHLTNIYVHIDTCDKKKSCQDCDGLMHRHVIDNKLIKSLQNYVRILQRELYTAIEDRRRNMVYMKATENLRVLELQRNNLQRMHLQAWSNNPEEILQDMYLIPVLKMFTIKRDNNNDNNNNNNDNNVCQLNDRIYTFNFTYDTSLYYCIIEEHEDFVSLFCVQSNNCNSTIDEQVPDILTFMLIDPTCANHCFMRSLHAEDWKVVDRTNSNTSGEINSTVVTINDNDNNARSVSEGHQMTPTEEVVYSSESNEQQYHLSNRTETYLSTYCQHYDHDSSSSSSGNKYQVLGWPNFIKTQNFSKFIKNDKFAIGVR